MSTRPPIGFDRFQLDIDRGLLMRSGRSLKLPRKAFAVLCHLAERPGETVTRDELLATIWQERIVRDDVLTKSVYEIRTLLGDSRSTPRFLQTVHGRGFRWIATPSPPPAILPRSTTVRASPPLPFVGRRAELKRLHAALAAAESGELRIVSLRGAAGMGKTRLLEPIFALARSRHAKILTAGAGGASLHCPYWPWSQLLRDYLRNSSSAEIEQTLGRRCAAQLAVFVPSVRDHFAGLTEGAINPATAGARFLKAMVALLGKIAHRQLLVLGFDDAHHASDSSLALLRAVAEALRGAPVLLLCLSRSFESQRNLALRTLFDQWRDHPGCDEILLQPLSDRESRKLIASALQAAPTSASVIDRIARDTRGNPYFMLEVVRSLPPAVDDASTYSVPIAIEALLSEQLAAVGAATRELLRVAALSGGPCNCRVAAHAAELSLSAAEAARQEAIAAGLIVDAEDQPLQLRLRDELLRATLLRPMSPLERDHLQSRLKAVAGD
ncbi:MAG TPA: AAA family ATPase [Terriglobales bacterium]|nr:AAA family ATPase [Terriglobales bacterium]